MTTWRAETPTGALLDVSRTTSVTDSSPLAWLLSMGMEKYSIPSCRALSRWSAAVSRGESESKAAVGSGHCGVDRSLGCRRHPVEHDTRASHRHGITPGGTHDDS